MSAPLKSPKIKGIVFFDLDRRIDSTLPRKWKRTTFKDRKRKRDERGDWEIIWIALSETRLARFEEIILRNVKEIWSCWGLAKYSQKRTLDLNCLI